IRILRAVSAGESYVPPRLAASLLLEMREAQSQHQQPSSPLDELTPREREILEGLAAGLSNKEIGEKLFLSEKTVKHYMTNILQKLQVRNRVEAALLAQKEMKKS
ncbi:MAG: response regulator transcription factor, partial [Chloroflexota bacterium]|nr:response regulator transcription factor [Chloroflexota bacterium]